MQPHQLCNVGGPRTAHFVKLWRGLKDCCRARMLIRRCTDVGQYNPKREGKNSPALQHLLCGTHIVAAYCFTLLNMLSLCLLYDDLDHSGSEARRGIVAIAPETNGI